LSIDSLKKYKPAAETYLWAKRTNCKTRRNANDCSARLGFSRCITCWFSTCFIAREGQSLYTLSSTPDFEATDILAMAEQLVAAYSDSKQSVDIQINADKIAKEDSKK
jgi:2-haloacid dehalogenase